MNPEDIFPPTPLPQVGPPLDRVDGRLKVTGAAKYSAEWPIDNVAHGVIITSEIACGRIRSMDTHDAENSAGALAVITPFNAPRMPNGKIDEQGAQQPGNGGGTPERSGGGKPANQAGSAQNSGGSGQQKRPTDRKIHLLQEDTIFYNNQPIGVVVANTLEQATYAASLVRVHYEERRPITNLSRETQRAYTPGLSGGAQMKPDSTKGDAAAGWQGAAKRLDHQYVTPTQTHNPMEPHAVIAAWSGDKLTMYDATQGVWTARQRVAEAFAAPRDSVHYITKFIGGGFGSKGPVWSHVILAAMAARVVNRPVKLALDRRQMFGPVGFRGTTMQRVRLGCSTDGKLTLLQQDGIVETSMFDEFVETVGASARMLYDSPNIATTHRVVKLNIGTTSFTRAPGEAPGMAVLETAMDEMAHEMGIDPIAFRLKNYAEVDPEKGKPFSSKSLRQCYEVGAEKIGWSKRPAQPGTLRDGDWLIGYGMASATYPTRTSPSSAKARMLPDGSAIFQAGTQDIGTGTYTIMTQIAAETLGVPPLTVRFDLGDTDYPQTPVSGGSQTAASAGSAVYDTAVALRKKIAQMAIGDTVSPLHGAPEEDVVAADGKLVLKSDQNTGETYAAILARHGQPVEVTIKTQPPGQDDSKFSTHAFGAHFAVVRVDPDLAQIRVERYVGAFGAGRILNEKTGRNQLMGGIVWGIGLALMEDTLMDHRFGRFMNADLAEYLVPVNADVPDIEVHFIEEQDHNVNPIGVKGIGEIGIVGAPAAIGNAIFNATGKRFREFPITPEMLVRAS